MGEPATANLDGLPREFWPIIGHICDQAAWTREMDPDTRQLNVRLNVVDVTILHVSYILMGKPR